jgi:hypothetical protein
MQCSVVRSSYDSIVGRAIVRVLTHNPSVPEDRLLESIALMNDQSKLELPLVCGARS